MAAEALGRLDRGPAEIVPRGCESAPERVERQQRRLRHDRRRHVVQSKADDEAGEAPRSGRHHVAHSSGSGSAADLLSGVVMCGRPASSKWTCLTPNHAGSLRSCVRKIPQVKEIHGLRPRLAPLRASAPVVSTAEDMALDGIMARHIIWAYIGGACTCARP